MIPSFRSHRRPSAPAPWNPLWALALFLLTGPVAAAALAAEPDADADTDTDDDRRVTVRESVDVEGETPELPALSGISTRLGEDPLDVPAGLASVGHPLIAEQGAETVSDALENVSGMNVQTGSGPFDVFYLRGFESVAGSLVLTDGAVDPESTVLHLYNVDHVEVLKGAAGFLYGGRSLAGTVNLVRKRPVAGTFSHFTLGGGSHGYGQATVDANWQAGERSGVRVNALWHTYDGFRDDNQRDAWAVNPTFSWRGERTAVDVSYERVSNDYDPDAGLPILAGAVVDVPRERSYASPFDRSEQTLDRFQLNVQHDLGGGAEWRSKLYYNALDWRSTGTILSGAVDLGVTALAVRTLSDLDDEQTFYGVQSEVAWQRTTGSVRHELMLGVELARLDDDFRLDVGVLPVIDIFEPVEFAAEPPPPIPSQSRFGDVSTDVVAPYLVDRIVVSDRFELLLGGRFDSLELDGDGTALDRDDEQFSPFAGVVVSASDDVALYANYAESFEPQSTLAVGELVPEEGEQVEAGVKMDLLDGALQATVAVYRLEKSNLAIPDQTGFSAQTGDQESKGLELDLAARLGDGFDLRFAYAYTDAELTEFRELVFFGPGPTDFLVLDRSGNRPAFAPEHLANLWLTRRFDNGFGFGLGARHVDEQFIAEDNAFAIDAYTLLDGALFYTRERLQLHLDLRNLTGEDYETRAFGKFAVSPAPGFEARASVRYLM